MLIDFHMHVFPDHLSQKALEKLSKTAGGIPYYTDGTVGDTVAKMKAWNVDYGVFMNIATSPKQQESINNWASAVQREHENIFCFGSVHPDAEDCVEELYRIKELGLKGVKLHPDYQNFFVDDERVYPIYDTLSRLQLPILFHAGYDAVSPTMIHGPSNGIARVAEMFPRLTIIAAHMGGLNRYDDTEEYLAGQSNVYLDTSMSASYCKPEQFKRIIKKHGADKILFATDCPWNRPADELSLIDSIGLGDIERNQILYANAAKLLGIE